MSVLRYQLSLCVIGLLCLLLAASQLTAQDESVTINLNPNEMTQLECAVLLGGFDIDQGDLNSAVSSAASGGYRFGYVMGYLHGTLDRTGKKQPLTKDEHDTFIETYRLLCEENGELSIYEAARDAMSFQAR